MRQLYLYLPPTFKRNIKATENGGNFIHSPQKMGEITNKCQRGSDVRNNKYNLPICVSSAWHNEAVQDNLEHKICIN
jgi:hypothetical protein